MEKYSKENQFLSNNNWFGLIWNESARIARENEGL
jgi:hypothetical protein